MKIHSFVLMPNHFHLIASFPDNNLSESMCYFMTSVSKAITEDSGRINQTFGAPFHSSQINTYHYFMHAYKYVYRNPLEARLASDVRGYQFSTLNGLLGFSQLVIPVIEDTTLFDNMDDTIKWLNSSYKKDHKKAIKHALTKSVFKLSRCSKTKMPHELNHIKS